jgi:hypothetical protein
MALNTGRISVASQYQRSRPGFCNALFDLNSTVMVPLNVMLATENDRTKIERFDEVQGVMESCKTELWRLSLPVTADRSGNTSRRK